MRAAARAARIVGSRQGPWLHTHNGMSVTRHCFVPHVCVAALSDGLCAHESACAARSVDKQGQLRAGCYYFHSRVAPVRPTVGERRGFLVLGGSPRLYRGPHCRAAHVRPPARAQAHLRTAA